MMTKGPEDAWKANFQRGHRSEEIWGGRERRGPLVQDIYAMCGIRTLLACVLIAQRSGFAGGWGRRCESRGAEADSTTNVESGWEKESVSGGGNQHPLVAL